MHHNMFIIKNLPTLLTCPSFMHVRYVHNKQSSNFTQNLYQPLNTLEHPTTKPQNTLCNVAPVNPVSHCTTLYHPVNPVSHLYIISHHPTSLHTTPCHLITPYVPHIICLTLFLRPSNFCEKSVYRENLIMTFTIWKVGN